MVIEMIREVFYDFGIVLQNKSLFWNASQFFEENNSTTVVKVQKAIEEAKAGILVIEAQEICSAGTDIICWKW